MSECYEFTKVNALQEDAATHTISFTTDAGKKISILDDEAGKLDIQFLRKTAVKGKVLFAAWDPVSGFIRFVTPFDKGQVKSLEMLQDDPPRLRIALLLRPSYVYLRTTHPRFAQLRSLFENAKDREVWVGTFPGDSNILDARLAVP